LNPWALFSLAAVLLTLGTGASLLRYAPPRRLVPVLPAAIGAAFLFSFGDLIAVISAGTPARWAGISLAYTGLVLLGPLWFWVAMELADEHGARPAWLASPNWTRIPLWIALGSIVAIHTNPWHGLFLTLAEPRNTYHALWYVQALNGYFTAMGALGIYVWMSWRTDSERVRRQIRPMAIAVAITPVLNGVYVFTPAALPFDLTTLGVALSCAILVVSLHRRELFSLTVDSLAGLLEFDSDAVLLVDERGRLARANPAAQKTFGQLVERSGVDVIDGLCHVLRRPRASHPPSAASLRRSLLEGPQSDGQLFRLGERWIRLESTPVRDSDGHAVGAFLRARDETELRNATADAAAHAAELEAVFAASGEGICVSDVRNHVRYSNERFGEILGLRDVRSGATLEAMLDELRPTLEDPDRFAEEVGALYANPAAIIQDSFALADGRIIERSSVPLLQNDQVRGRVWRLADITEDRRSDEALRNAQKL